MLTNFRLSLFQALSWPVSIRWFLVMTVGVCSIDHRGEEQDHLMDVRDGGSKLKSREMKGEKERRGREEKDIRGRRVGGGCRDD